MTISSTIGNQTVPFCATNREFTSKTQASKITTPSSVKIGTNPKKSITDKIMAVAVKTLKFLATVALAIGFPGTFIAGLGTGVLIRVTIPSDKIEASLDKISRMWKNQSWLARSVSVAFAFYAMPVTLFMASFARGAQLGLQQA